MQSTGSVFVRKLVVTFFRYRLLTVAGSIGSETLRVKLKPFNRDFIKGAILGKEKKNYGCAKEPALVQTSSFPAMARSLPEGAKRL